MGKVLAVCTSPEKGTAKYNAGKAEFIENHGIKGDAHAGPWHRQVSLLSHDKIEDFRAKGAEVADGAFGENLVVEGIDFRSLPVGTVLECGNVVLEMTQIGKECHSHCAIFKTMGDCIMPREGVFSRVLRGGFISAGDEMKILRLPPKGSSAAGESYMPAPGNNAAGGPAANNGAPVSGAPHHTPAEGTAPHSPYRVWIITSSDKGFRGEREDLSAPLIREIVSGEGYAVSGYTLLPDDEAGLERELCRVCDSGLADLILTSGGTGFSARDRMPEATAAAAERFAPGIAEAMRGQSMTITRRAMLSRGIAAIRGSTLIINLPGSPKAVRENLEFIIPELRHGLDILCARDSDCGQV